MGTEKRYITHILLLICALLYKVDTIVPYADVKSDYETLLSAYEVSQSGEFQDVIPKNLTSGPLVVYLGLSLHSMVDFDAVDGSLQLGGTLNVEWQDEIRELSGVTFKQTESPIVVTKDQIWTPDLVVINSQDFYGKLGDVDDFIRYNTSTGECTREIMLIMKVSCTSDMVYFPYDEHNCALTVRSWLHGSSDVPLSHLSNQWNTDLLEPSALWDVTRTSTELASENTHDVIFKITIKRKPQFISTIILTPMLVISFLSLFTFIIPPFSQERICFSVTCFASFVVLQEYLTNIIPRAFFPVSLVCVYILIMLILNVSVCIVNVVMMRIHLGKHTGKVPAPLQKVIKFMTLCPCKGTTREDAPYPLERQDTVFNIRFAAKNIGEDLNGEIIEEEDSVFGLSDDSGDATEKAGEYGDLTDDRGESTGKVTEKEKENVGMTKTQRALDKIVLENNAKHTRHAEKTLEGQMNDPEKESISSLETTYTTQMVSFKPTLVEEGYTLSFNTYLPRSFMSNKLKTSTRHDVIGRRSRLGNKSQKRKPNTDITPVEHAQSVPQIESKSSVEVTSTLNEIDQINDKNNSHGKPNDRKDSSMSNDCSKTGASVSDRSDGAYVSAGDSKTDSDDGRTTSTRFSSSTKTHTTSLSSATIKVDGMTWSHVGQVLDIFFMILFAFVQIIFTFAFIVPMSNGK